MNSEVSEPNTTIPIIIGSLGGAGGLIIGFCVGWSSTMLSKGANYVAKRSDFHILPNNSQEGDLNRDGLFPDAYLKIEETGKKILFYLHKDKIERYVPGKFMENPQDEENKLIGRVNYEGIERKLNGQK